MFNDLLLLLAERVLWFCVYTANDGPTEPVLTITDVLIWQS